MCENGLGVAARPHPSTTHGDFCTTPRPKSDRGHHQHDPQWRSTSSARSGHADRSGHRSGPMPARASGSASVGATMSSLVRVGDMGMDGTHAIRCLMRSRSRRVGDTRAAAAERGQPPRCGLVLLGVVPGGRRRSRWARSAQWAAAPWSSAQWSAARVVGRLGRSVGSVVLGSVVGRLGGRRSVVGSVVVRRSTVVGGGT